MTNKKITINVGLFRFFWISCKAADIQETNKKQKELYIEIFNIMGKHGYSQKQIMEMLALRKECSRGSYDMSENFAEKAYKKFKKPFFTT